MNLIELKSDLKTVENVIVEKELKLTGLRERITEECKPFIKSDFKNLVEIIVKTRYDITKSLGPEKLSHFKQELSELIISIDNIIDIEFANDKIWKHHSSEKEMESLLRDISYSADKFFIYGIDIVYNKIYHSLGRLLFEYKYLSPGYYSEWSSVRNGDKMEYCPESITKGEPIERLLIIFRKDLIELVKTYEKKRMLIDNILKQEAADLWNNA